jgi:hypothetical protein
MEFGLFRENLLRVSQSVSFSTDSRTQKDPII